jgi:hypothetical protein
LIQAVFAEEFRKTLDSFAIESSSKEYLHGAELNVFRFPLTETLADSEIFEILKMIKSLGATSNNLRVINGEKMYDSNP